MAKFYLTYGAMYDLEKASFLGVDAPSMNTYQLVAKMPDGSRAGMGVSHDRKELESRFVDLALLMGDDTKKGVVAVRANGGFFLAGEDGFEEALAELQNKK